jgi:hypothetical protein
MLAHAGSCQPVLYPGLSEDLLLGAPPPQSGEPSEILWDVNSDPNNLPKQRWGIVAPSGARGDRLLALIEPLRRARQEAQGAPVIEYRLPAQSPEKMDGPWAMRWKKEVFRQESKPEAGLPRYLLVLGDLDEVPLSVQQVLSTDAFVGRLAFRADAGYEAYVSKVLRWEGTSALEERARMLFYTSRDGTPATQSGYQGLISPSVEACRRGQQFGDFPLTELLELGREEPAPLEQFLAQAAQPQPGVLFSLSHGAVGSLEDRPQRQGALLLPGGRVLMGEDVASRPFLPGGVWFFFACFSAGTPARSSYAHWLSQLQSREPEAARALSSVLLPAGERPFIAALPQAVLANPDGPLAVMGHVDLAWSYGFKDHSRPTPSRFLGVLKVLAEGGRAGVALSALQRFANETSVELALLHNEAQRASTNRLPSPVHPMKWAELWMVHQDLSNYILLGDPAVRLPLQAPAMPPSPRRAQALSQATSSPAREPAAMEAAVLELLSGRRSLEAVASRYGVTLRELRQWEDIYRSAGRSALARHGSVS